MCELLQNIRTLISALSAYQSRYIHTNVGAMPIFDSLPSTGFC